MLTEIKLAPSVLGTGLTVVPPLFRPKPPSWRVGKLKSWIQLFNPFNSGWAGALSQLSARSGPVTPGQLGGRDRRSNSDRLSPSLRLRSGFPHFMVTCYPEPVERHPARSTRNSGSLSPPSSPVTAILACAPAGFNQRPLNARWAHPPGFPTQSMSHHSS